MMAILLYPGIVSGLAKKNAYDKVGNLSKAGFTAEQKMSWQEYAWHALFEKDQEFVAELVDVEAESVQKLVSLYVERSHVLYKGNDVIVWMREIIGFLISAIN